MIFQDALTIYGTLGKLAAHVDAQGIQLPVIDATRLINS